MSDDLLNQLADVIDSDPVWREHPATSDGWTPRRFAAVHLAMAILEKVPELRTFHALSEEFAEEICSGWTELPCYEYKHIEYSDWCAPCKAKQVLGRLT